MLLESDILAEFLLPADRQASELRQMLAESVCFTTFVQVSELLACVHDKHERALVDRLLGGIKVLGLPTRYSEAVGRFLRLATEAGSQQPLRQAIVLAVAHEARLTIVSHKHCSAYRKFDEITAIEPNDIRRRLGSKLSDCDRHSK